MEQIKNWIASGGDYKSGVELMLEYHPNKGLSRNLAKRESEAHWQMLRYELEKLAAAPEPELKKAEVKKLPPIDPHELMNTTLPAAAEKLNVPNEIAEIIIQQGKLYNKRCVLSNHLVDHVEDLNQEERKKLAEQIEELRLEYNELAQIKREWHETGKLRAPKEVIAVKAESANLNTMAKDELLIERSNLRSNHSKVKKAITRYQHQPAKIHSYKEKEARIVARLDEIEKLLKK